MTVVSRSFAYEKYSTKNLLKHHGGGPSIKVKRFSDYKLMESRQRLNLIKTNRKFMTVVIFYNKKVQKTAIVY